MRNYLMKSMRYGKYVDIMYMANDGAISKRRIKVLQVGEDLFQAYCYLRRSRRTFRTDNVLALVPVIQKESMVI